MKDTEELFYRYAGQAMSALISKSQEIRDEEKIAKRAADYAEALINELATRKNTKPGKVPF